MSFLTGTSSELIYASTSAGTAKASFTTEAQINDTAGMGVQAAIPAYFVQPTPADSGKALRVTARGILSSTATPTYTFTLRLGTAGSTTACIALGSAALTTTSGASNQPWEFEGDIVIQTPGATGANTTLRGTGLLTSSGLATTVNALWGGAASPGTTSTFDTSIVNFFNFNVACSASSASNTITIHQLMVMGLN